MVYKEVGLIIKLDHVSADKRQAESLTSEYSKRRRNCIYAQNILKKAKKCERKDSSRRCVAGCMVRAQHICEGLSAKSRKEF